MSVELSDPQGKGALLADKLRKALRTAELPTADVSTELVVLDVNGDLAQRPALEVVSQEVAQAIDSLPAATLRDAADVYSRAEVDTPVTDLSGRASVLEGGAATLASRVSAVEAAQTSTRKLYQTWAALSAVTGAAGDGAEVVYSATGTHTDPVVGGAVSNPGIYVWSASPAGWKRVGDTPTTYFSAVAGAVAGANFLPDSYNEFSSIDQQFGGWNWWLNGWPSFDATGANSGLKTPSAKGPTVSPFFVSKWYSLADLPIKTGDACTVSVLCWFANAGGTVSVIWRNDANTSVGGSVTSPALPSGLQTVSLQATVPAGATKMDIRIQQLDGSAYEGIGYFASSGIIVAPARNRSALGEQRRALGHHGKNLHPDPFFRLAERGVTPDAFYAVPFVNVALTDLAASPFRRKKALAVTTGTAAIDSWVDIERLGLKAGDKLTIIVAVYGSQTVDMRLQFKDAANATVVNSGTVSKTISGYDELRLSFDITAGVISTADRMEIRLLLSQVAAAGLHVIGYGVFVNSWPTRLHDDSRRDEVEFAGERPWQFGFETLRQSRLKMRQRLLGMSAVLNIGVIGNSWSALPSRWTKKFADYLQGKYGDGGSGFYNLAWSAIAEPQVGGGGGLKAWNQFVSAGAHWSSTYRGVYGPALGHITATTSGATTTIVGLAGDDACALLYQGVASGQIRHRWNGGAWTLVNVSTAGMNWVDLAGIPSTDWTLDIEVTGGLPILCGLNFTKAAPGVRVHKLAANGSKASEFAAVDASWANGVDGLDLDLCIILHGTNDQDQYLANLYASKLDAIITNVRTAAPGCDILIGVDPENNRANGTPMAYFAASARDCALRRKVGFLDLQGVWGDPAVYAYSGARPWMDADLIHPTPDTGGVAVLDAMVRAIEG